jgi:hypothetical protein
VLARHSGPDDFPGSVSEFATGTDHHCSGGHSVGSCTGRSRRCGNTLEQLAQCAQRGQEGGPAGEAPVRFSDQEVRLQGEVAAVTASGECSERFGDFAIARTGDRHFSGTEDCIFDMDMSDERCEHGKSRGEGPHATSNEIRWIPHCPEPRRTDRIQEIKAAVRNVTLDTFLIFMQQGNA